MDQVTLEISKEEKPMPEFKREVAMLGSELINEVIILSTAREEDHIFTDTGCMVIDQKADSGQKLDIND